MFRFLGALVVLLTLDVRAEPSAYLVRDLPGHAVRDSLHYGGVFWTNIGTNTWFTGTSTDLRLALFKTDGTPEGTVLVADGLGRPDVEVEKPVFLGVVGGKLIYGAVTSGLEKALFAVDSAGGARVPLMPLDRIDFLSNGVVRDADLYFSARTPKGAGELWKTDGTPAGTVMVDLTPGEQGTFDGSGDVGVFEAGEWMLYFGRSAHGTGLHRTDGTAANTALLVPLSDSALYNRPQPIAAVGNRIVFRLETEGERTEALWSSDGTPSGTMPIAEINWFDPVALVGGKLLFVGPGRRLWATDGTRGGTGLSDIPVGEDLMVHPAGTAGDDFYFFATDRVASSPAAGIEKLYVTRGTAATTRAITVVDHGNFHYSPNGFAIGRNFFFRNHDDVHGSELWKTDGTTAELFLDIYPGAGSGFGFSSLDGILRPDGKLIFAGATPEAGREPWITDGTVAGTRLLANVARDDLPLGSSPRLLGAAGDRLFFTARLAEEVVIGVSDGTRAGTRTVPIPFPFLSNAAAAAGRYFFTTLGRGLYVSDGTSAGTFVLQEGGGAPIAMRGGVLFRRDDGAIWFSDGTSGGTRLLIPLDIPSSSLRFFPAGDRAWIVSHTRLWLTDGTIGGTTEITPPAGLKKPVYSIVRAGAWTYLLEEPEGANGARLWRSDGTSAGTTIIRTLARASYTTQFIGATGQFAYFTSDGNTYRTDGTEAGTILLATATGVSCTGGVEHDGASFFTSVGSGTRAMYVWRSDGTPQGTTKAATVQLLHYETSRPRCLPLKPLGGRLYFPGWDGAHGWEPWVTDGTPAGTKLVTDIWPGREGSTPDELTVAGDRLFFSAESPATGGRELWAIGASTTGRRRSVGRR